jgi:hypothetical protein
MEHQTAKHHVDFRRRQSGASLEPPSQHAQECTNDKLHHELPRSGAAIPREQQLLGHEVRKNVANLADRDGATTPIDQRTKDVCISRGMLKHGEAEPQRLALRSGGLGTGGALGIRELPAQCLKTAAQQVLFAGVVAIEGGAADRAWLVP